MHHDKPRKKNSQIEGGLRAKTFKDNKSSVEDKENIPAGAPVKHPPQRPPPRVAKVKSSKPKLQERCGT